MSHKTGTLTKGEPTVTAVDTVGVHTEDTVLALASIHRLRLGPAADIPGLSVKRCVGSGGSH